MHALLGKITEINLKEEAVMAGKLEVSFKPVCVLPRRTSLPEWLKDQTLKIEREVVDPREVGHPGDSIVLSPEESRRWLYPLSLEPELVYGEMPEKIRLRMAWWKGDNAPDFTVRANGRQITGKFTKEGEGYWAEVDASQFFSSRPKLPVSFEVACDKLNLACTVLPEGEPVCRKLVEPEGEVYRVENDWYVLDVVARSHAGGISSLVEKGRGVDHFRIPQNRIQGPFDNAGFLDRVIRNWNWWGGLDDMAMASSGTRREGEATHLALDGGNDEVRTSVGFTFHDDIPLISVRRDYSLQVKKQEENKDKPQPPKEPIDDLQSMGVGFRAACMAERNGGSGSRVLCVEGERLATIRCSQVNDVFFSFRWLVCGGWVVMEHPERGEYMMYLFDEKALPRLLSCLGPDCVTLEPMWLQNVVKPGDSRGYHIAFTAGELCGASTDGAWVACRTLMPEGGVRCAVIARTNDGERTASFTLGGEKRDVLLEKVLLTGVGPVSYATADFAGARMEDGFDVIAAGIAARRRS